MITKETLQNATIEGQGSIHDMSLEKPVLLVFLRHFGCIFCKEALNELKEIQNLLKEKEVTVVLVHMSDIQTGNAYLEEYGLSSYYQISDPDCKLYAEFGLVKGNMGQLFGLKVWTRGFDQIKKGNSYSMKSIGDAFQMPGVFFVAEGSIKSLFVYNSISDKPDYLSLIEDGLA